MQEMENIYKDLDNWLQENKEYFINLLSKLVQIKTENLPPGGNEKPGQEFLYNFVSKFIPEKDIDIFEIDDVSGIRGHPLFFGKVEDVEKQYKDRPNLVVKLEGSHTNNKNTDSNNDNSKSDNNGFNGIGKFSLNNNTVNKNNTIKNKIKSFCFSGHMDTMPCGNNNWKISGIPNSGLVKDGKLYGRGSADMKAGTLAGFLALKFFKDLNYKLSGDVYAESVIDEENGGVNGTIAARLRHPNIDFAILAESTGLDVGIETIGGSDFKVTVKEKGPGGISSDIELPNPIYKLSKIACSLESYDKDVLAKLLPPKHFSSNMRLRLLTYQIYSGGSCYAESGSVPTNGHIYFWLESFSNMSEKEVKENLINFMKNYLSKYEDFKDYFPKIENVIRFLHGHKTDLAHPAIISIKKAYNILNLPYTAKGIPLAMDAYAFKEVSNTEVVVIGPKGENLHGEDECVYLDSWFDLIKIMVLTAYDCLK